MNQTNRVANYVEESKVVRPQSPSQVEHYIKACRQKRITPQNIAGLNYEQTREILAEIFAAPSAPTEKQYGLILEIAERLGMKFAQDQLAKLNFDTAQLVINKLIEQDKEARATRPAEQYQIDRIAEMYMCPDVDMSDLDIPNRIEMGTTSVRTKVKNKCITNEKTGEVIEILTWKTITEEIPAYRLLVPDELKEYLSKVTYEQANDFYNKYRDAFSAWKKTRISDAQITAIRNLEKASTNMSGAGRPLAQAVTFEGDQIVIDVVQNADRTRRSNMKGYESLPKHSLMQFSYDEASAHIQRIRDELFNPDKYKSRYDELNDSTDMRDIHLQRSTNTGEWNDLNDMLYKLMDVAGYHDDTLIQSCLDTTDSDACKDGEVYIRGFMLGMVERGEITMTGLFMMVERSQRAMEILLGVEEPKDMKPKHVMMKEREEMAYAKDVLGEEITFE